MYRKVTQVNLGENRDCLPACIATLIGEPLASIPNFIELSKGNGADFWGLVSNYLKTRGYTHTITPYRNVVNTDKVAGVHIVLGASGKGTMHAVLYKDGRMFHDPHPNNRSFMPDMFMTLERSTDSTITVRADREIKRESEKSNSQPMDVVEPEMPISVEEETIDQEDSKN